MSWRERVVIIGLVPAILVLGWLLFAPFEAQTQVPPVREGDCGPALVAVFRQPGGDELRFACALAADDRVAAAGVVGVAAGAWVIFAPKVLRRQGRGAALSLWVALAGGVLLLAPFTAEGDLYQADDGSIWRESLSCPAPPAALRYANVDGSLGHCADRETLIRVGVGLAAVMIGAAVLVAGRRSPSPSTESAPR